MAGVGDTPEEAIENYREGLELYTEDIQESGEEVPDAAFVEARYVEVDVPHTAAQAASRK